jgi:hypothetical protein
MNTKELKQKEIRQEVIEFLKKNNSFEVCQKIEEKAMAFAYKKGRKDCLKEELEFLDKVKLLSLEIKERDKIIRRKEQIKKELSK